MKVVKQGELAEKGGYIEYKMSKMMAQQLIKEAKAKGLKKRPQEVLVDYVNRECGLKGQCIKVLVEL